MIFPTAFRSDFRRAFALVLSCALLASTAPIASFAQEFPTCPEGQEFSIETESCVAVPDDSEEEGGDELCAIVSDPSTQEGGDAAVVLSEISEYWNASISGAFWIWGEDPPANQDETTYETFTRTFTISGIPESAELQFAADDGYYVSLNENYIGGDNGLDEVNFTLDGQDSYSIPQEYFIEGENILRIEAANIAWGAGENPAGILFRLLMEGVSCDEGETEEETGTLVIKKALEGADENAFFTFTVAPEEGEPFTMVVETEVRYGSSEEELPEGQYTVSEVVPDGWTLDSITCSDEDSIELSALSEEETALSETVYLDEGETITCTFTNVKNEEDSSDDGNDGNDGNTSSGPRAGSSRGQVLGASTECSPLLTTYLGRSYPNPADEVTKLQNFLNDTEGAGIPVTGVFDAATENAVRVFQAKYWEDVLKPWFAFPEFGVLDSDDTTGIVYKTTKWKVNNLVCPGSEPLPALP